MYYLHTSSKEIVAMSQPLLQFLHIENFTDFHKEVYTGKISFEESLCGNTLELKTPHHEKTFALQREKLTTLLGTLFIVSLEELTGNSKTTSTHSPKSKSTTLDLEAISQQIGISQSDYYGFLGEYFSSAIALEEELKSEDKKVRKSALSTLSQLSKTLQLTMLQPALNAISEAVNYKKRLKAIEQFYATLIKITTLTPPSGQTHSPKGSTKNSVPPYNKFDAEPYNYHKVAKELSLPKKLIHSLLKDFVTGTKKDILRMKQHLTQGESSEVKQIIHSLKGAANNLRLHTISHILSTINQSTSPSDTTKNLKQLKKQIDLLQKQL